MNVQTPFTLMVAAVFLPSLGLLSTPAVLTAAEIQGTVVDPAGRPIPGAQVAAFNDVGLIVSQITDGKGHFDFNVSPLFENYFLHVTAPGFQMVTVAPGASSIQLPLAPQTESVRVTGSAIDVPASQQGTSVSVITSEEIRQRNEAQTVDLMRELPGLWFAQSGPRGSVAGLFVRGGDSNYNLVELNGIPINSFYYGGLFDFSQMPSDFISEIDVARGPQSAVYGSYALSSVVGFVTRTPDNGPALDILAEGGTHDENRFAISGSMLEHGWGFAGSLSSLLTNGPVPNSDYRSDNTFLSGEHRWYTQNLFLFGSFNSNNVGEPGPYGSDPLGLYPGIDLISRSKNNTPTGGLHYQNDFTQNVRLDLIAGFFLNNSGYISPYGYSFNKDLRPYGDARATWRPLKAWTLAAGFAFDREEMRNTYVSDLNANPFDLRRDNEGIYIDNHFAFLKNKLFFNLGGREEVYQTDALPAEFYGYPARPAYTLDRFNPKISGVYMLTPTERLHASFGTGIRPPGGDELAFTDNPALQPERTESYDVGLEQRFLNNQLSLDVTWFHTDFRDLIVSAGGSLSEIYAYQTDNVARARAEGVEATAHYRPATWLSLTGSYTWLESEVLSLDGGDGLVQQYYYLGQPLERRPKQSGSAILTFYYKKLSANLTGYFRGRDLDVEPNDGLTEGQYWAGGYVYTGVNINYQVRGNLTAYANVHNALDRRYEEVFGYPAPLLTVVGGLKWSLAKGR